MNSIAASEGLVNVSKAFFNKSARHEKPNKNVKNVSDMQVGKTCFISSVSENTCLNEEAHAANRNEIVNNGAKFEENNRVCDVVNRTLQRDLEVLKLDVTILENRLPAAIVQNESNIDSLRRKQKDMEIIIHQQQQTICNLKEENQLFKSKFKLLEKQLFELTQNNQRNNVNDHRSPVCASNISSETSPSVINHCANPNANLNYSNPICTAIPPLNNIVLSINDHSDSSGEVNSVLNKSNAPLFHTSNVVPTDGCLEDQSEAYRLEHQLTSEQLPEKQIMQPSFDDQIKEYIEKHKESKYDQYKTNLNSTQKKVRYPRARRRENIKKKSPSNVQYARNLSVGYITRPGKRCISQQKRYNFYNAASTSPPPPPPDWDNYLNLVYKVTTSQEHQFTLV